jgi:hypothetical protein
MDLLPKEVENIINDYKNNLEHKEKLNKSLKQIENMKYEIVPNGNSRRIFKNKRIIYHVPLVYYQFFKEDITTDTVRVEDKGNVKKFILVTIKK